MTDINAALCRDLLKQVMVDVRKHATPEQIKAAWVYKTTEYSASKHYEFHGPSGFYWYGRADGAYDARYKGWCAWLTKQGVEGYAVTDDEE
jgi:hypothetical protein